MIYKIPFDRNQPSGEGGAPGRVARGGISRSARPTRRSFRTVYDILKLAKTGGSRVMLPAESLCASDLGGDRNGRAIRVTDTGEGRR